MAKLFYRAATLHVDGSYGQGLGGDSATPGGPEHEARTSLRYHPRTRVAIFTVLVPPGTLTLYKEVTKDVHTPG
jgi:hypothetical protein